MFSLASFVTSIASVHDRGLCIEEGAYWLNVFDITIFCIEVGALECSYAKFNFRDENLRNSSAEK